MSTSDVDGWPGEDGEAARWPHDLAAEEQLLATLMRFPDSADAAIDTGWRPDDMYRALHQEVALAIVTLADAARIDMTHEGHRGGHLVDPVAIIDQVGRGHPWFAHGAGTALLARLATWPASVPYPQRAAALIHELAMKRRLIEGGIRQVQQARDPGIPAAEVLARAETDHAEVTRGVGAADVIGEDPRALVADRQAIAHDWVVPGLIDAADKAIFVGWEGHGKTRLLYQAAMCVAAGVHPFLPGTRITPQRTVMVNLEVARGIFGRTTETMLEVADQYGIDTSLIRLWSPDELDLRTADGQMALTALVRRHRPRLLCAGPMYQMGIAEGQAEGADYLNVARFLNRLRKRYGCALWLEQHAPMAKDGKPRELRPIGTVLWTKWPDFGWGLKPVKNENRRYELYPFRDPREAGRAWPRYLYWRQGPGWPWAAEYDEHAFDTPLFTAAAAQEAHQADAEQRADELAARRAAAQQRL